MIHGAMVGKPPEISHFDFLYAQHGNPVKFLGAFLAMRRVKYRKLIGWDRETLEWVARVWEQAAIAAVGKERLRDACLHEKARYIHLANMLLQGEVEHQSTGMVMFDRADDWPPVPVVRAAMKALEQAEVKSV
jgi:hypothetical protein